MRVRFLSGNAAGGEQDLPQIEAELAIQSGYAEAVTEALPPEPVVEAPSAPADVEADEHALADPGSSSE